MSHLKSILTEVIGLFVDDGSFALAVVVWLGLAWLVLPQLHALDPWTGILVFLGFSGVLVESVLRRARR